MLSEAFHKFVVINIFCVAFWNEVSTTSSYPQNGKLPPTSRIIEDSKWYPNSLEEYPISLPALHRLVLIENQFCKLLKKLYSNPKEAYEHLRIPIYKYLKRYETEVVNGIRNWNEATNDTKNNFRDTLNHPFMIFQMLRRLVYDFPSLYESLANEHHLDGLSEFKVDLGKWPSKMDANYYGSLVVVLHHFYDFNIHKFGRGTFGKIVTGVNVSAVQGVELNYIATKSECHSSAVEFMAFALDQATKFGGIPMSAVRDAFKTSIKEHDNALGALSQQGNYGLFTSSIGTISNFTHNRHKFITRKSYKKHFAKKKFPSRRGDAAELEEMDSHNYMSICKGENWQTNDQRKSLKCWYKPISTLCPYKIEMLNQAPILIKVHDFIERAESNSLMKYALPKLAPGKKLEEGHVTKDGKIVSQRAGLVARIEKDFPDIKVVRNIETKIKLVTGLNVDDFFSGEPLQIASSLPGGYMNTHLDSLGKSLAKQGHSRLATFMIYLNKVSAGGRTAFHRLGLAVKPMMHAAVFWYNHDRNGNIIDIMAHGGCPIILGQKWVATKWIRARGNMNMYSSSSTNKHMKYIV